jgi:signal recognition particle subunit SRP54
MFESLSEKLESAFKQIKGEGRITELNIAATVKDIRRALVDADVNYKIAKDFTDRVKDKAMGEKVLLAVSPGQQMVKIVKDELAELMGGSESEFNAKGNPAVILIAGLQGSGKTTFSGKLANFLKQRKGLSPMLVAADIYRPAAIDQLKVLGEQIGIDVYSEPENKNAVEIAQNAIKESRSKNKNVVIIDTAGRLAIDEAMMQEIAAVHAAVNPIETLFVVDAMVGQDAINTAKAFNDALPLTGVILTKLDGDSRGGAALSVRHVTGKPIKFAGVSEKLDGLEAFDPARMANRVLGMGDILALVEEARKGVDMQAATDMANKIKSGGKFDMNDFRAQLAQMKKMGGMAGLLDKLPAQFQQAAAGANMDQAEKQVRRMCGIIDSMTPLERAKPDLIKANRKRRIAAGAGVQVQEVNRMLNQYEQMNTMMKKLKGGGLLKMMRGMKGMMPGMR